MMQQRLGITLPIDPFINRRIREAGRVADECGYTDAWSFEANSSDAFSPIASIAMLSDKLRFGPAVVRVFTCPACRIAMSAATVANRSGGRFVLGLGISSPAIVQKWM